MENLERYVHGKSLENIVQNRKGILIFFKNTSLITTAIQTERTFEFYKNQE